MDRLSFAMPYSVRLLIGDGHGRCGLPIDPFQNTFVAACEERGSPQGIISTRRRQHGRQPGGFVGCEVRRGLPEVMTGRGFSTIDALSSLGDVEV